MPRFLDSNPAPSEVVRSPLTAVLDPPRRFGDELFLSGPFRLSPPLLPTPLHPDDSTAREIPVMDPPPGFGEEPTVGDAPICQLVVEQKPCSQSSSVILSESLELHSRKSVIDAGSHHVAVVSSVSVTGISQTPSTNEKRRSGVSAAQMIAVSACELRPSIRSEYLSASSRPPLCAHREPVRSDACIRAVHDPTVFDWFRFKYRDKFRRGIPLLSPIFSGECPTQFTSDGGHARFAVGLHQAVGAWSGRAERAVAGLGSRGRRCRGDSRPR